MKINLEGEYPAGVIVETESGFYYLKDNTKIKYISTRAAKSWGLRPIKTKDRYVKQRNAINKIGFRDGSLICNIANLKIYLISNGKRRPLHSPEAFKRLGLKRRRAVLVSHRECIFHEEGEPLT